MKRVTRCVMLGLFSLMWAAPVLAARTFDASNSASLGSDPVAQGALAGAEGEGPGTAKGDGAGKHAGGEARKDSAASEPIVTHHEITVGGRTLKYTVTTGMMPIKNDVGETEAQIFFMAYTMDHSGGPEARPLMFSFNGGPGSASVWLHLGAIGPKRVKMLPDGGMPAPPYKLVDNEFTWLDQTDLVFIDPVGTGYSRASKPELGKKFWGVRGDLESVGEFIRLYLTRNERWASPLFLVGESYGTTRAAGLSGYLVENSGIAFNGIVLVSSILNFQTADFSRGNELPYSLFLPTYTATAWYHKKLPADLQSKPVRAALEEAETFAANDYPQALSKGTALGEAERTATLDKLARLTGLDRTYLDRSDLRVSIFHFCKELLRDQRRTVGRIDSRFKGIDESAISETPDYDPSIAAVRPPYTAMFNQYVRADLNYKSDATYYILGGGIGPWDWGSARAGFPDVSGSLREAFAKNPDMKLFVASGHFDLATPYFATKYTLDHLGLEPAERARVTTREYEAGHMMYIDAAELSKLKQDVSEFIAGALKPR
jgi:carboxypeptidase C (cathepsin A)